ncbi:bifunctional glycoside hydrolase 114/ polysaccharide deacetylase family protein, partial [Glaciimonas sp. GG7]
MRLSTIWIHQIYYLSILLSILFILSTGNTRATENTPLQLNTPSNYAFYYGNKPPIAELQAFDNVVLDPDSNINPNNINSPHTQWLAYVSVGEVAPGRTYAKTIPPAWFIGQNTLWKAKVIDQSAPGWPAFFVANIIAPLWDRGFRGFFLDTLDSYQLVANTPDSIAQQQAGLINVIKAIKVRYPDAKLIFNRGFDILPAVGNLASAIALESLYSGWDQASQRYTAVPEPDRQWLLAQIKTLQDSYRLPVIAIDYCAPGDHACAESTVARITALGITPYVTDGALQTVGTGRITVIPRRILIVQNLADDINIDNSDGVRFLTMPLNYLGYKVEYADTKDDLPENITSDVYAGIIVWANGNMGTSTPTFIRWLKNSMKTGVRVAFMNQFGAPVDSALGQLLGLKSVPGRPASPLTIASKDPMIGFEIMPPGERRDTLGVQAGRGSTSLLRLQAGTYAVDAAAITPWGGYVLSPYAVLALDDIQQNKWATDPLAFFRRALNLSLIPVPDTTTENGRRLLMAHVDGDGYASRNEFFPGGFPGESLYKNIWEKYKIPTTLSIIEGEVGAQGMYPNLTPQLEALAKRMFALPYVEIGSHTYSHPFEWDASVKHQKISEGKTGAVLTEDFHLNIPGYVYNLDREIAGTIGYINNTLTTRNKPVAILLWPGSCDPPAEALRKVYAAGVLNMNGGDTLITKTNPSWTAIAPLGVNKGPGAYQIYAPNQNEDLYTNEWTGPFYGFERVIETFQMTDTPIRFKPVDIYYHMYSGTKLAALKALQKVYDYALAQPNFPVYATEYVRKVIDFENLSIARAGDNWIIRGAGDLRTIRIPSGATPNLASAEGVAGYAPGPGGTYVHLTGNTARFSIGTTHADGPYLDDANGRIANLVRTGNTLSFDFSSHVRPILRLAQAAQCTVTVNGKQTRLIQENLLSRID